ncbi:MAG: tripartite tricarboxylate transporter substrate binding protein [Burkholderiales bacterium]|nr:tripartite tricarboxylate transporter substrate binding protein [Burkholderiales bacterium]
MKTQITRRSFALAALTSTVLAAGLPTPSAAQAPAAYPDKPIRFIVPFAPGGTTDILARQFGQRMSALLGQPVIIENKPGGGTMIGAEYVAKSAPDGYTLLVGTPSLWLNPLLYKKVPYKVEEFTPVSTFAAAPFVLSVSQAAPAATLSDLVKYGQANPGKLSYGILGVGGPTHLLSKMFEQTVRISGVDIPYRGTGLVWPDLLSGRLAFYFDAVSTSLPMYRANKIRVFAVTSEQRSPVAPEIPTFKELGYPALTIDTVFGLFAPAKTPRAVVERLSKAAIQVAAADELRNALLADGTIAKGSTPEEYTAAIQKDLDFWTPVIKPLNLQLD